VNVFAAETTPNPAPFIVNVRATPEALVITALTVAVTPAEGVRVKDVPAIVPDPTLSIIDPDETVTVP
jgi:hypothetical protein